MVWTWVVARGTLTACISLGLLQGARRAGRQKLPIFDGRRARVAGGVLLMALTLGCGRSDLERGLLLASWGDGGASGKAGVPVGGGGSGSQATGGGTSESVGGSAGAPTEGNGGALVGGNGGAASGAGGALPNDEMPSFIDVTEPRDVVHDAKRGRLYVSTEGGLLPFDLERRVFVPRLIEGKVMGLALSPDENLLVAATEAYVGAEPGGFATNFVYVIDLESGVKRKLEFSDKEYETGTFMPAFFDDSHFLVSSSSSAPLRFVDLRDGTYEILPGLRERAALLRSADGSVVSYAVANTSGGEFGYFRVSDRSLRDSGTGAFAATIGVSRNAQQFAVPSDDGVRVYDQQLARLTVLRNNEDLSAYAVAYSPVKDEMYVAWQFGGSRKPALDVWDTRELTRVRVLARGYFGLAMAAGALRTSRDGRWLFACEYEGVDVFEVGR